MIPVVIVFGLFGWWIFGRDRATATAAVSPQSIQHAVPARRYAHTRAYNVSIVQQADRQTGQEARSSRIAKRWWKWQRSNAEV